MEDGPHLILWAFGVIHMDIKVRSFKNRYFNYYSIQVLVPDGFSSFPFFQIYFYSNLHFG